MTNSLWDNLKAGDIIYRQKEPSRQVKVVRLLTIYKSIVIRSDHPTYIRSLDKEEFEKGVYFKNEDDKLSQKGAKTALPVLQKNAGRAGKMG